MGRRKSGENVNADLCEMLLLLADYEKLMTKNTYKSNAYKQAAEVLAGHPVKIRSGEEAQELEKIGCSIAEIIDEYISNGKVDKVEKIKRNEDFRAILELTQVSGIGPSKARELVRKGIKTIKALTKCSAVLNRHQLIGLKYFNDFQLKIPRSEIEGIERILIETFAGIDGKFIVTICGSYRRGKPSCSDVDCLVTHPDYTSETSGYPDTAQDISLRTLVSELKNADLVVDTIALGPTKFMGVCQLNSRKPARRLDLRLIPIDQYACAILCFTGSDLFIKNMKAHALSEGYNLTEFALLPVGSSGNLDEAVPVKSERDIFEFLNYPYKPPSERDV